jgi:hypothetical protein
VTIGDETSATTTDNYRDPSFKGRLRQSLPGKTQLDGSILYFGISSCLTR